MKSKDIKVSNNLQLNTMKKKVITFLLVGIFILAFAPFVSSYLGTYELDECVNIKTILNVSSVNISTISYPNSTFAVTNKLMTKTAKTFIYEFCNTTEFGNYIYDYFDSDGYTYVNDFDITPNGKLLNTQTSILYIGIILFFIFLLCTSIYGVYHSDTQGWLIGYICFAYVMLFGIFFILWQFAVNYLWDTPLLGSIFWILWLVLAIGFLPFVIFIAWYIIQEGFKEAEVTRHMDMGYTRKEALSAKNKR